MMLLSVVGTPAAAFADNGPTAPPWPGRLTLIGELRVAAELAWEHSLAFREQCRALASAGAIVIVEPVTSRDLWRAETRIMRTEEGVTIARARVRPGRNTIELIAHELEHVLEHLQGVSLLMESSRGGGRVTLSGGAYETQRALDAGRRVAQEVHDATTHRHVAKPGRP